MMIAGAISASMMILPPMGALTPPAYFDSGLAQWSPYMMRSGSQRFPFRSGGSAVRLRHDMPNARDGPRCLVAARDKARDDTLITPARASYT